MPCWAEVDECCDRLRLAGWPFGWRSVAGPGAGERSLVDGHNGENALRDEAATLAEALCLAYEGRGEAAKAIELATAYIPQGRPYKVQMQPRA